MATHLVLVPLFGMPGLGEWILIFAALLLFFGAAKLPQLGKGLGEGIRNFKKGLKGDAAEEKPEDKKLQASSAGEDKKAAGEDKKEDQ